MSNFVFAVGSMILNNTTTVAEMIDSTTGNPLMAAASLAVKCAPVAMAMYATYKAVTSLEGETPQSPKAPLLLQDVVHVQEAQKNEVDPSEDGSDDGDVSDNESFVTASEIFEDAPEVEEIPVALDQNTEETSENHLQESFKEMGEAYRASHLTTAKTPSEPVKPVEQRVIFTRSPLVYTQVPVGYIAQAMMTAIGIVYVYRPVMGRPFVTTLRSVDKIAYKTTYAPVAYAAASMAYRAMPLRMQTAY